MIAFLNKWGKTPYIYCNQILSIIRKIWIDMENHQTNHGKKIDKAAAYVVK